MKISSIIGMIAAFVVLFGSIFSTSGSKVFLDPHGLLVVFGGTTAASLMCFKVSTFFNVFKIFFQKFLGKFGTRYEVAIHEIVDLATGNRDSADYMKTKVGTLKTLFLKDAIELVVQGGISDEDVDMILLKRATTHFRRYDDEAQIFKTMAKFPPAFGLLGTTLGMIALLQTLGSKDSYKLLGPAMAIGLVATFWGIALANLVLIPIGENLSKLNKDDEVLREIVMDGIRLLRSKAHPRVVEEHLKSYLLPAERAQLKKAKA